jgi:Lar family restriction alleviation protein
MAALSLLPCPFCGGQANTGEVDGEPSVWCSMCGATLRTYSETGAVDLWNTRVALDSAADACGNESSDGTGNHQAEKLEAVL